MKLSALASLVRQNVRRGRRSFALSVFGIAVGISSLSFFLALSSGVRAVVQKVFPAGQVEVVPASSNLGGPLSLLSLGGPKPLTDETVALFKARPDVRAAYRRMRLAFPARAVGGHQILGRDIRAELIAEGIDAQAMADAELGPEPFSDDLGSQKACATDADCASPEYCPLDTQKCERPVPAVVSPFLIEIYNGAIAPSHGLPRMGGFLASRFKGFTFTAELGVSFFALPFAEGGGVPRAAAGLARPSKAPPRERRLMLVGIAPRAAQLALTVPLGALRRWNAEFAGPSAGAELSSVMLELTDGADVARLGADVRALGYQLADSGAERVSLALALLTLLFALVSFAIVAVAAINIAHTFFRVVAERRREIGVLRAVGASSTDVQRLFLAEALFIGLCGGLAGLVVARLGASAVDAASRRFVPDFPFKPESYFSFDWRIIGAALLCSLVACAAGALWPARAAARLDPTEALSAP